MSGNLTFYKTPNESYELVFDYTKLLGYGETIKSCVVYVNNTEIVGTYDERYDQYLNNAGNFDTVFTYDPYIYDNDTILIKTSSGVLNEKYNITVSGITNRRRFLGKSIDVFIDEYAYPEVFNEFEYRYLVDYNDIYILPAIYENHPGFIYNTEFVIMINHMISSVTPLFMEKDTSFTFTSKYCPMFTSAAQIILLLGPEAEKFTEDTINRYIYKTSKEAIDLLNISGPCGGTPRFPYDYYGCTPDLVPYNLRKYVECKTAYDLLNLIDRLRLIGGSEGGQTKTLGDMTIKYDGSGGNGGSQCPTCGPKKDLYDCYTGLQNILSNGANACGVGGGINNAVRGKYDVSKGYAHPTRDLKHNRIIKPSPNSNGPWYGNGNTRYPSRRL